MEIKMQLRQTHILSAVMQNSIQLLMMNNQELRAYLEDFACSNIFADIEYKKVPYRPSPFENKKRIIKNTENDSGGASKEQFMHEKFEESTALTEVYLQAVALDLSEEENRVLIYLIKCLDANGFLTETAEDVAEILGVEPELVRHCTDILQNMDPPGIGGKNAEQALHIQLRRLYPDEYLAHEIISSYFKELAAGKYELIAKALSVSHEEVVRSCGIIRNLNPKPLNGTGSEDTLPYIVPDFYVLETGNNGLDVIINDYYLPKVYINPFYRELMHDKSLDKEDASYIKNDYNRASDIINFLSYRITAMQDVAEYTVNRQKEFFTCGPGHRHSLSNKQVASALGFHESTVSRTICNKYFECKWGVFPMNILLCHSVKAGGGSQEIEYDKILCLIRKLIEEEAPSAVLSDQNIADLMKKKDINISRRTVAKYRQQLGIPNSMCRQQKKNH